MSYVKTPHGRSFHIFKTWSSEPGIALTFCGKRASGDLVDDFGEAKTCETCYRVKARTETTNG